MSDRRASLLARFRATARDRLRRASLGLIELEAGRGTAAVREEVARELHTLKGEARMLGQAALAEAVHGVEERLRSADAASLPPPAACTDALHALEAAAGLLPGEAAAPGVAVPPAPAASVASAPAAVAAPAPAPERWIQASARRVDEVCERLADFAGKFGALAFRLQGLAAAGAAGPASQLHALVELADSCRVELEDVTGAAWALRLEPVEPLLQELVQHAHELAGRLGKRVRLAVHAGGAQLERRTLDGLREPLLHLVRNALDHGLEPAGERGDKGPEGTLVLEASTSGSTVVLAVADDGRGVDPAAVRAAAVARGLVDAPAAAALSDTAVLELIFAHGFSTRAQADDLSGRGVGLDVVRRSVEALGGRVGLASRPGRGTRFELTLPASIVKERALVIECGALLVALPSVQVREVVRLAEQDLDVVAGGFALRYGGELVPLCSLSAALALGDSLAEPWGLIVESAGRRWAFSTPTLVGDRELVRRPVDAGARADGLVTASAMLPDGRLVLILAVSGLLRRLEVPRPSAQWRADEPRPHYTALVVDDSPVVRDLVAEALTAAGLLVRTADDGEAALRAVEAALPDVVVLDVEMPGLDGFAVLARLRARAPRLPVIMLTTRASPEDRRQAVALGADAYLIKSEFRDTTLVDTVRRFVGGAA